MSTVIGQVVESLKKRLPGARIRIDEPLARTGLWHIDVSRGGHAVVLQWSPQKGFGVSAEAGPGLGEGPHEVYDRLEEAVDRTVRLVETGEPTDPPREARLGALRDLFGISQQQLAASLGMRQASVSKLERQTDMKISTLEKIVRALGAELEIAARVGETRVTLTQFKQAGPTGDRKRARA